MKRDGGRRFSIDALTFLFVTEHAHKEDEAGRTAAGTMVNNLETSKDETATAGVKRTKRVRRSLMLVKESTRGLSSIDYKLHIPPRLFSFPFVHQRTVNICESIEGDGMLLAQNIHPVLVYNLIKGKFGQSNMLHW